MCYPKMATVSSALITISSLASNQCYLVFDGRDCDGFGGCLDNDRRSGGGSFK